MVFLDLVVFHFLFNSLNTRYYLVLSFSLPWDTIEPRRLSLWQPAVSSIYLHMYHQASN
jgi:hypothetical protein